MVMEMRRTPRVHTHEEISQRELIERLPEMFRDADIPPDKPVDVGRDEHGNITIAPHQSRFAKLIGIAPGLERHLDPEADRQRWAERDAELGITGPETE